MTAALALSELVPPLVKGDSCLVGKFWAMGSPCEIVIDSQDPVKGRELLTLAQQEAQRIEKKFSRYLPGNAVDQINTSRGKRIQVDSETADLLDFAASCFEMSHGLFDITTGVLRKVWKFNGSAQSVSGAVVQSLLPLVGWSKVKWERPYLKLPIGMEIDLGGICKEYAVDRIVELVTQKNPVSVLVNLGGDIAARGNREWRVGIESTERLGTVDQTLQLRQGALATSGTMKRFAMVQGERRAHILNPQTGWPVENPPRSVTVAASTCTEAGFFSTLALLHGAHAETYLRQQNIPFWSHR